jgi:hypothetical protein
MFTTKAPGVGGMGATPHSAGAPACYVRQRRRRPRCPHPGVGS